MRMLRLAKRMLELAGRKGRSRLCGGTMRPGTPGSPEAVAAGCTCSPDQPDADRDIYVAETDCPLHGLGMLWAEIGIDDGDDDCPVHGDERGDA